jgi:hypothetical protein
MGEETDSAERDAKRTRRAREEKTQERSVGRLA